jgi:hypothetical protein
MKLFLVLLLLPAVNLPSVSAQQSVKSTQSEVASKKREAAKTPFTLPAEIKVILKVEELPGIENPKSFWEGVYEVRVADWHTIVEKTKSGGDPEETGVVVLQSSFARRSFSEKENRTLTVSVPVAGSLLERLQQQPQNPQAFLLRSTVRFFDAQLNRNFALKIDRIWRFKLFPDGEATISIKIKPDGSSSIWGPIPKEMPPGYTIIGVPPPTKKP